MKTNQNKKDLEAKSDIDLEIKQKFPKRKVFVKTYGCQMNVHDTERIFHHLKDLNYSKTENKNEADLVLFNTCSVRDLASLKFYSHLGEIKRLKKEKGEELLVGACGCVAQIEGRQLLKKFEHLDFVFGTDVIDQVPDILYRLHAGEKKVLMTSWDKSSNFSIETKITHGQPQAFINIIKGCDKFCSYCHVPFTRGREKSRRVDEVVNDIRRLVEVNGIQEVMLLGQNVNSYGLKNGESLAQLILELEKINGLELIRYTTSHPYDVSDELIAVHGEAKKLSKHLHLPVQSGSNTVLERMLREYTAEHFLGLVEKLKKSRPDIVLSTDIICGFPNETDAEFQDTLKLLDKVKFDFIYSYTFSVRAGTKAARMKDNLTDEVRGERLRYLQAYQLKIQEKTRQDLVGKTLRVLVDGTSQMHGRPKIKGRTNCMRIVHAIPPKADQSYLWHWVDMKITKATALSCQGEVVKDYGRILG